MCLKSSAPFPVMPHLAERLWGFNVPFPLCACVFFGLPNSVRGTECSRGRSATHDHTVSLPGKCPQGITGVSFYLAPSINSLYLHLHGWIRETLWVLVNLFLKKKKNANQNYECGKILHQSFHHFTAFLALFCGLGAICWHGVGHNSGENLYCQRGERGFLFV